MQGEEIGTYTSTDSLSMGTKILRFSTDTQLIQQPTHHTCIEHLAPGKKDPELHDAVVIYCHYFCLRREAACSLPRRTINIVDNLSRRAAESVS